MAPSPAKLIGPVCLGALAGGSMAAPAFMLPRLSSPGLPSARHFEGPRQQASSSSPLQASMGLAGMASIGVAGASLLVVRAALRKVSRSAKARSSAAVPEAAKKPKRPPPPPFDPAQQVGAIAPLGYFDPLGFAKKGDKKGFRELREAELKHGRVAMMASVGLVMQHFVHLNVPVIEINVKTAPYSLGAWAVFFGPVGFFGLTGVVFFTGLLELVFWLPAGKEAGDFGDPLGLGMYTEDMRNKELSNGRFAMIAVAGIFAAELATGKDCIQQLGL